MRTRIEHIVGWEALDSRGRPTVACDVRLAGGAEASVMVPSGASTGRHEAHELRDGDPARYAGLGVLSAVSRLNDEIAPALTGRDADDTGGIDALLRELDGTPQLERLGANAVLAATLACADAAARAGGEPLFRALAAGGQATIPLPMVNILSGGAHAGGLIDIQDVLFVPVGATSFAEAIEWTGRVRAAAAELLTEAGGDAVLIADEGGLAARLPSNRAGVELVANAISRAGLEPGVQGAIALDIAATQLLDGDGAYRFACERRTLSAAELVDELAEWIDELPIVSIEDPVGEDDAEGWDLVGGRLRHIQVVGDDLFATNQQRLELGEQRGWANAVLVKVNQNGTLHGALGVLESARAAGMATVVSARSGETEDAWLADLAVGTAAGQIKVGSTMRSERTSKWNRLLRIESVLAPELPFAGAAALAPLTQTTNKETDR
jgi:enolase